LFVTTNVTVPQGIVVCEKLNFGGTIETVTVVVEGWVHATPEPVVGVVDETVVVFVGGRIVPCGDPTVKTATRLDSDPRRATAVNVPLFGNAILSVADFPGCRRGVALPATAKEYSWRPVFATLKVTVPVRTLAGRSDRAESVIRTVTSAPVL
jgi:hypothetical protein